jgi:hypothetical protein
MSIWIDLLFMHGHFATPRSLEHLLKAAPSEEAPSVPAPKVPPAKAIAIARTAAPAAATAAAARSGGPAAEAAAISHARAQLDDAASERLAAPLVVTPGAFTRSGVFVSDPVAIAWPSAPVLHPLRVVGQLP